MQRYFLDEKTNIIDDKINISNNDFHHIKNVMRMKVNDKVYCCINSKTFLCSIDSFQDECVILKIENEIVTNPELNLDITIAHGLVRREKMEEVIRRICELGAYEYIPVSMERSIIKISNYKDSKIERQKTIIKEACEQSHRTKLMKIRELVDLKKLIDISCNYDLCLFAYEESGRSNNYNFKKYLKEFSKKSILILVGPEGGFSDKEVSLLEKNNFKAIGLGPRILRTETAPLYLMAAISYEKEIGE